MRTIHILGILVLLAVPAPAAPAHAGGVVTVCDEAHLLAALAGGGTVTFSCSGTITLTAEITIAADTTVDGSGQTVTISGNNAVRVFTVNSGVALNLDELTIANGSAGYGFGGGILNYHGTVTLKNTIVANSPTGNNCSGIITDGGGNLSYPDATCPGINSDPLLGPLQNNGSPTETMALGEGSAALDAGADAICAAPPVNNLD